MKSNYIYGLVNNYTPKSVFLPNTKIYTGVYGMSVIHITKVKHATKHTYLEFIANKVTSKRIVENTLTDSETIKFGKFVISAGNKVKKVLFSKSLYNKRKREETDWAWDLLTM